MDWSPYREIYPFSYFDVSLLEWTEWLHAGKIFSETSWHTTQRTALWAFLISGVERILGGRLHGCELAASNLSVGTARYSDLSGTHPSVWGWLCFYLHMEFWGLTHSLSSPALQRLAGLPCGLCKPMLRRWGQPEGHGLGPEEPSGLLSSHWTKLPGGGVHKATASTEDSNKQGRLSFLFRILATCSRCLKNVPRSVKTKPGTKTNKSLT